MGPTLLNGGRRSREAPVAVLGGSGMLGSALLRVLAARDRPAMAPTSAELDLREPGRIAVFLEGLQPAAVVNAAGYTDVAGSELDSNCEIRDRLNRDAPAELASACATRGLPLVHLSTDFVFDGTKRAPYVEEDAPAPLQAYGRSKLEGERAVQDRSPEALIVRTSTLYGPGQRSRPHYVDAILAQARRQPTLSVVRLPVSSPTLSDDLAQAIVELLVARASGIVHVTNAGECSRLELARETVRCAGLAHRVEVVEREGAPDGVARPPYSVLSNARLTSITGRSSRPWQQALADYVARHG